MPSKLYHNLLSCAGGQDEKMDGVARSLAGRVQGLLKIVHCGWRMVQAEARVRGHRHSEELPG